MWLYFVSCTDSTHAPRGFLETETLLFDYKGFVVELCFQQDVKDYQSIKWGVYGLREP